MEYVRKNERRIRIIFSFYSVQLLEKSESSGIKN